ncbi:MAG TPA: Hdr-like menaquinol oxidoreductase cytochrome c subunit [Casimicrobiaceae bacterium]
MTRWTLVALALIASTAIAADAIVASRVPKPALAAPSGERCVEEPQYMRRNHPDLLRHERDRTVHEGVRATRASLAGCVSCHASPQTGRVTGGADAFCESCHRYAGVTLDCFECHADRPKDVAATALTGARP